MRLKRFLLLLAIASLILTQRGEAAKYRPKVSEVKTIQDMLAGLDDLQNNVSSVQCGGWDPQSTARIIDTGSSGVGCKVDIRCHNNTGPCQGITGGFAGKKQADGTIPIDMCLPAGSKPLDGSMFVEYTLIHELTHAKQFCPLPPGADLIPPSWPLQERAEKCCDIEMEAYTAACSAMQSDGLFDQPYNGIFLNAQTCAEWGTNYVSCKGFTDQLGPVCGNTNFPPGFDQAYTDAIFAAANFTGPMCRNVKTNPPPRVKELLDEIEAMSQEQQAARWVLEGNVPLPWVSPDVPGRANDPTTALKLAATGIAPRGQFEFPSTAEGYLSACDIRKDKYHDEDLAALGLHVGVDAQGNELPAGDVEINPKQLCLLSNIDKATPMWCKTLFDRLKTLSATAPRPVKTCTDNHCDPADTSCKNCPPVSIPKTYCFDFTLQCTGQQCRTPWLPRFIDKWPKECKFDLKTCKLLDYGTKLFLMSSFYRHYAGPLLYNAGITVKDVTGKEWKLRSECYEYYKERDPKLPAPTDPLTGKSFYPRQCEIIIATGKDGATADQQRDPKSPEWENGEYLPGNPNQQKEQYKADPPLQDLPRESRELPPGWRGDDKTNISLIGGDIAKIQLHFDDPNDITGFMDALIPVKLQASKTVNDLARTDGFDDSAIRDLTKWWEEQQKELLKITREPTVKLMLPARFLTGLSESDPLFRIPRRVLSRSTGVVELTLRAGSDDLGTVLESLRRAYFLPIREVRIPFVLPIASETELLTRKREWEAWALINPAIAGQASEPIAKIDGYLQVLSRARLLRLFVAQYLTSLYPLQSEVRGHFGEWYVRNSQKLLEISKGSDRRRTLMAMWRRITKSMLQTDACQKRWCSTQRYSEPVYSLLDGWARPETLPDLKTLEYSPPPDYAFDFSSLGLPDKEVALPVLWPVTARLKIPLPPTYDDAPPSLASDDFPDLPPIPDPSSFGSLNLPQINGLAPLPTIVAPPSQDKALTEAQEMLAKIRQAIDGTPWENQLGPDGGIDPALEATLPAEFPPENEFGLPFPQAQGEPGEGGMRGEYCAFTPSIIIPPDPPDMPDPNDEHGDGRKILHVENDLKERIGRLFSHWAPQRKEDYGGRVVRLLAQFGDLKAIPLCKEDVVCVKLPGERFFGLTIELLVPEISQDFTTLYDAIRTLVVPSDEQYNPYFDTSVETIRRLFPPVKIPIPVDLSIPQKPAP